MHVRTTPKYLLIEHRLGRSLDEVLAQYRAAQLSAPAIGRLIAQQTGIKLSPPTIRQWVREAEGAA